MYNSRFATWMTWALILGMVWAVVSRVSPDQAQAQAGSVPKEGFAAPDITLSGGEGGKIYLSELRGSGGLDNF